MEIWIRVVLAANKVSKNDLQFGLFRWKEAREENQRGFTERWGFCFEIIFGLVSGQIQFQQILVMLDRLHSNKKDSDLLEIKLAGFVQMTLEVSTGDGKMEICPNFSNPRGTPETQKIKKQSCSKKQVIFA